MVLSLASGEPPRMLWTDRIQQALRVIAMPEIQRVLDAGVVNLDRLELGAGGAYVALTSFAHFHGAEVAASGFPDMVVDTEELRGSTPAPGPRSRAIAAGATASSR